MAGHNIHLVGSVPLASAEKVFTTIGAAFGTRIKRIPDGETGTRKTWLGWLEPVFSQSPVLQLTDDTFRTHDAANAHRRYGLKPGASIGDFRIDNLLYADVAKESYAIFKRLRDAGKVPPGTRFQIDFAPGHSAVRSHIVDALLEPIEAVYNEAIEQEVAKIAASLPHEDIAIQFDAASAVFERLQNARPGIYGKTKEEMEERFTATLAQLANSVPRDIELLFHFCYGDNNHRHSVEPKDMGDMVDMANRLHTACTRPINLIHMPVPRNRSDDAYFAPLRRWGLAPETELCLGLVHFTDGIEGTKRRMATARNYAESFVVATECGLGRRKRETIPELLRIHVAATDMG